MTVEVLIADYGNPRHAEAVVELLDCYARDPMGGGQPLAEPIRTKLVPELAKIPGAFSVLCFVDGEAAGLANCLMSFSSFACKPIVNIHDIVTSRAHRGTGLAQLLMQKVEEVARQRGCCKITLEVLEGNTVAQSSYRRFGFAGFQLDPAMGNALFWQKYLD